MKNFNLTAANWSQALTELQERAGYTFHDKELLRLALTHSSYASESPIPFCQWNERLEFLGDAVLQLIVTHRLYLDMPNAQEGELTRSRSVLVDEPANARNAKNLTLDRALLLGKGECQGGGRERASLLGDAFEAFLGAVYLDGGFEAARGVVERIYPNALQAVQGGEVTENPKGLLQIKCQAKFRKSPEYREVSSTGPSHAPHFVYEAILPDGTVFKGEGNSKKVAEQNAAYNAILQYHWDGAN